MQHVQTVAMCEYPILIDKVASAGKSLLTEALRGDAAGAQDGLPSQTIDLSRVWKKTFENIQHMKSQKM